MPRTQMDHPVTRVTVSKYRQTVTGAWPDSHSGRRIVVELRDDHIRMREEGRRTWYRHPVASVLWDMMRRGALEKAQRASD